MVVPRLFDKYRTVAPTPTKSLVERHHFGRAKQRTDIEAFLNQNLGDAFHSYRGKSLTTKFRVGSNSGDSSNAQRSAIPVAITEDERYLAEDSAAGGPREYSL
jgi:hypothetical protein